MNVATQNEVNEARLAAELRLLTVITNHGIAEGSPVKSEFVRNIALAYRYVAGGQQPGGVTNAS